MIRWKTVGALSLAAAALAACGSSGTPPIDVIHNSPALTLAQRTATLTFTQVSDASGKPVTSSGSGGYDFETKAGRFDLVINGIPGIPDGSKASVIISGTTVYAHLLTGTQNLVAAGVKTPYIKLELLSLEGIPGLDLGTIAQAESADPIAFLDYLRGAVKPVTTVGTEQVSGVTTTHYKFDVDLNLAVTKVTGDDATVLQSGINHYAVTKVPTEVWLDSGGLVRQMTYTLSVKPAPGKTAPVHQTTTFQFTAFGAPVDTAAPPASQVTDLTTVLAAIAKAQG